MGAINALSSVLLVLAFGSQGFPAAAPNLSLHQSEDSISKPTPCSRDSLPTSFMRLVGQISFLNLEGGMFELRDEQGRVYDLHNLSVANPELTDYLRAHQGSTFSALVIARVGAAQGDIHMHGTVAEVEKIFVITVPVAEPKLTNELRKRLAEAVHELIPVKIIMRDQLDVNSLQALVRGSPQTEARMKITAALKELAETSQHDVRTYLEAQSRQQNKVARIKYLWLTNAISAFVSKDVLLELAEMPSVARIDLDEQRPALIP